MQLSNKDTWINNLLATEALLVSTHDALLHIPLELRQKKDLEKLRKRINLIMHNISSLNSDIEECYAETFGNNSWNSKVKNTFRFLDKAQAGGQ